LEMREDSVYDLVPIARDYASRIRRDSRDKRILAARMINDFAALCLPGLG